MLNNYRFDGVLDPQAGVFFDQELTQVRGDILQMERRPRSGFLVLPQATDIERWADHIKHRVWDAIGSARWIEDYSDDFPMVDAGAEEEIFNVREFACGYAFGIKEIEQSQHHNRRLDRMRALAARLVTEEKHNRVMMFGDPSVQIFGMLNYPRFPRRISTVNMLTATPAATLAELHAIFKQPYLNTGTVARPDTFLLPPAVFTRVGETPLADGDQTTILESFMRTNITKMSGGTVEVLGIHELEGAGPNGEDLAVAYEKVPEVIQNNPSILFEQRDPQPKNFAIITPCRGGTAGVTSQQPLHVIVAELTT